MTSGILNTSFKRWPFCSSVESKFFVGIIKRLFFFFKKSVFWIGIGTVSWRFWLKASVENYAFLHFFVNLKIHGFMTISNDTFYFIVSVIIQIIFTFQNCKFKLFFYNNNRGGPFLNIIWEEKENVWRGVQKLHCKFAFLQ